MIVVVRGRWLGHDGNECIMVKDGGDDRVVVPVISDCLRVMAYIGVLHGRKKKAEGTVVCLPCQRVAIVLEQPSPWMCVMCSGQSESHNNLFLHCRIAWR